MAFKSVGRLNLDLLQIEINQIGKDAYDKLPPDAVAKMKQKADDMATAIKTWMGRQELQITEMDAPVIIPKKNPWTFDIFKQELLSPTQVKVQGTAAAQQNLKSIRLKKDLYGRAQLTSGRRGKKAVPQSETKIYSSLVQALEPKD